MSKKVYYKKYFQMDKSNGKEVGFKEL